MQWVLGFVALGVKHGWCMMLTTRPDLVLKPSMRRSYTSSPPMHLHGMQQDSFTLLLSFSTEAAQVKYSYHII
jgi:hypothetical protein